MSTLADIFVVLPSLDPDEKLTAVIDGLLEQGFSHIILINDGSKTDKLCYFKDAAKHPQVHLLHHHVNRGKGAALKTAFTWLLENHPDAAGVVTVDGDNQHHSEDTKACALRMLETGNIVLGVRDFSQPDVPARSRFGNRTTSLIFKLFVGMTVSDTQTGLRAIPTDTLPLLCAIDGDRFEYETNMLLAMKTHRLNYEEVKIRTVYIEENKSSHFRVFRDSWRIYKLILSHFIRYTLSSFASAVVDWGLYVLLSFLLQNSLSGFWLTFLPLSVARIVSSVMNFFVNQRMVFQSKGNTAQAFVRYFTLAIPQAIAQFLLTHGSYLLFQVRPEQTTLRGILYAAVMSVLFFFSYTVQQRWVFVQQKK